MSLFAVNINNCRAGGVFLNAERREKISHYVLIYVMIAMGDSFLYDRVLTQLTPVIAIAALFLVVLNRNSLLDHR